MCNILLQYVEDCFQYYFAYEFHCQKVYILYEIKKSIYKLLFAINDYYSRVFVYIM